MFKEVAQKHVTVCMRNGIVLEGFVTVINDKYGRLVELDNNIVVLNLEDVSFVRLGLDSLVEEVRQEEIHQQNVQQQDMSGPIIMRVGGKRNDFSMSTPKPGDFEEDQYRKPEFARETEK